VQGGGGDAGAFQPAGEFVGEYDVGELGLAVRPLPGVAAFALQVVDLLQQPERSRQLGAAQDRSIRVFSWCYAVTQDEQCDDAQD